MLGTFFKIHLKENLKDLRYRHNLKTNNNFDFYYVHPTKTGGTFLANILENSSLNIYKDRHELKMYHIPANSSVIISIRDPIKRFESSFYSLLHKRKNLQSKRKTYTERWKKFYSLYPDINSYVQALKYNKRKTLENSFALNDHVGRFSNYSYWLKSSDYIKKLDQSKLSILRVEFLNDDIELFFEAQKLMKPSLEKYNRFSNSYKKVIPINKSNIDFLRSFLKGEYTIVNTLLELKNLPPYNC